MNIKLKPNAMLFACTAFLLAMSLGATFALQDVPEKKVAIETLLVEYQATMLGLREQLALQYTAHALEG